jgi:2,4-dienoyl-CoA reductase (NADPH2)
MGGEWAKTVLTGDCGFNDQMKSNREENKMANSGKYNKLFEPGIIGGFKVKSRIIRPGAETEWTDQNGMLNLKKELPYYEALAKGGVGFIIMGALSFARFNDDKIIPDYRQVTDIAHKYGVPIFAQFMHSGGWVTRPRDPNTVVSASAIPLEELKLRGPDFSIVPRELTTAEIKDIIDKFVDASQRAIKSGYDGIEINAATCHLGNSFLSRAWNRRQDEYGCQSFENRARFVIEIKDAIKKNLGQNVPVGILINGGEFGIKDGLTSEETQEFAKIFEKAGFCYINVRAYGYMDYWDLHLPDSIFYPEAPKPLAKPLDGSHGGTAITVPLAAAIKKQVKIPVFTVGRLSAELGEKILEEGKADYIGLVRRLVADPEYPNKIAAGKPEDIAPCTFCMMCFGLRVDLHKDIKCRINAAFGGDEDFVIPRAEKKKKVVVVGGGPAGMEAARVVALRGHDVTLYDKERKLGGLLPLAALVKGLEVEDLEGMVLYFKTQLTKLGVKVNMGKEVTASLIEQIKPDAVIIATGGVPTVPQIPGIKRSNVLTTPKLHRSVKGYLNFFGPRTLRSLTRFYLPIGERVIIMGGALHGGEMAEFMVKRGRKVTIVDTAETIDDLRLPKVRNVRLSRWLAKKGVPVMTGVKYEEITDKGLTITTKDGKKMTLEADSIIPAMPWEPNTDLFKSLQGKVPEVYAVGDCQEPRLIMDAIADGYWTARKV